MSEKLEGYDRPVVVNEEDGDEIAELQERLGGAETAIDSSSSDDDDAVETSTGNSVKNEVKKGISFSQWQVESNDNFGPCSATEKTLPAGMYVPAIDSEGALHLKKIPPITDKLVELHDSVGEKVIKNVRKFWEKRERYLKRGILFKRGVLLWGPPGSGKTVIVQFLIRDLVEAGGVVLMAHSPVIVNQALQTLRRIEPNRPLIVVLEDIDEIMEQYSEHELLALLDGEHQVANVVNIATTNFPERLGARIINRPSRFDEVHKVGMPKDKAREQYLRHSLGDELDDILKQGLLPSIEEVVTATKGLSIAHLRELVVATTCLEHEYNETLVRLKGMKTKPKSEADGGPAGFKTAGKPDPDEYKEE